MGKFFDKLQTIDRRILYISLFLVVAFPFFVSFKMPLFITPEVKKFYQTVEKVKKDKIVIVAIDWDAATMAENYPQTEATIEHLMRRGLKFALLCQTIQGPELANEIAERLSKKYDKKYGQDWCNWGFKPGGSFMLQALCKDIPKIVEKDVKGTPITEVAMMKGVKDIHDVGLIAEFTGSGTLRDFLGLIQGVYGTPIVHGCTAIIAPENYPYLDTGQLSGMLTGMKGAAEYERLLHSPAMGTKGMNSQSLAHSLVIFLILLGNISFAFSRKSEKKIKPGEEK